jgi:hypothetical protein
VGEHSPADDLVLRIVELEQEGFARLEIPELPTASGLPEVYLV